MRRLRRWRAKRRLPLCVAGAMCLAVCLIGSPGAQADASQSPLQISDQLQRALEACRSQTNPADAAARAGIGELCPQLASALNDSGLAANLPRDWKKSVKLAQLADLEWLLQRYQSSTPSDHAPDPQALSLILKTLQPAIVRQQSWWQHLLGWLRSLMNSRDSNAPGWVQRLFDALRYTPHWVPQAILYTGLAVSLGLIIVLVWREARILRADRRRAHMPALGRAANPSRVEDGAITLSDVDAAPLRERPVLLLRVLIQALVVRGRLGGGVPAFTHGELVDHASFSDADERQRFARIAVLAEARRFADDGRFERQHGGDEIERLLADGRALYAQMMAAV